MQTTLKQQAAAVKRAAKFRRRFFGEQDGIYKALNDAYSTLISLQLNVLLNQSNSAVM